MIASCDECRWISLPWLNVVVRRIREEILELLRIVRRTVIRNPRSSNRELVESQHVHDADGGNCSAKQFRTLRQARANKKSAIASSHDGQPGLRSVSTRDQPFR